MRNLHPDHLDHLEIIFNNNVDPEFIEDRNVPHLEDMTTFEKADFLKKHIVWLKKNRIALFKTTLVLYLAGTIKPDTWSEIEIIDSLEDCFYEATQIHELLDL